MTTTTTSASTPSPSGQGQRWPDPAAFCADVRGPLVGTLTLFCGERAVAEELAQEALVRAFQRWDSLEHPRAWTYRTAFNLGRSRFRRLLAERRARATVAALPPDDRAGPDPADVIAVREAVAALPPRQRQVILCRFYLQLPVAEAAAVMGCADGTVKALTSQAITSLRSAGLHLDDPREGGSDG